MVDVDKIYDLWWINFMNYDIWSKKLMMYYGLSLWCKMDEVDDVWYIMFIIDDVYCIKFMIYVE